MQTELRAAIRTYTDDKTGDDGQYRTELDSLVFFRHHQPSNLRHAIYRPAICINIQGSKQVMIEEQVLDYGEMQYLVVGVDLPAIGRIQQASITKPFLALAIDLETDVVREVLASMTNPPTEETQSSRGAFLGDLSAQAAECVLRIVRLLDTPDAISTLYPLYARELYYWLLRGPDGAAIARIALPNSQFRHIAQAIHALKEALDRPIRVDELAEIASMSPSSFYSHFRAVTSMTPIQFHKRLRLLEARRLMMANSANVTEAAYKVGYESVSQFSREYARMFGAPPRRDMATAS